MNSNYLFLFGAKKTIPDTWSSNWNWVFTHFNIVNWLHVVKFRKSSSIRMKRFLRPWKNIFGAVFWLTLYINIATFKIFNLYTLRILFDWNNCFVCSNFPLLQIMRIACFWWLENFFKSVISLKIKGIVCSKMVWL